MARPVEEIAQRAATGSRLINPVLMRDCAGGFNGSVAGDEGAPKRRAAK